MRLAVLTNAPSAYRVPIFARMAEAPGVELRVFFDAASDASTRAPALPFPYEMLPPGVSLWTRNYQDEPRSAERKVMRFGWHYLPRLSAFRPDVVISGEFGWRTLNAAAWAAMAGVPLLVWWEATPFTERRAGVLRTRLRRALARRATGLLGLGAGSVACLEGIAQRTPVRFVPQAVDNGRIAREADRWREGREALRDELSLRGTVLVCASRLIPKKGIPELLAALARLRNATPDGAFTLLLLGDGPLRGAAEQAARELRGALRVQGAVPPDAIPRYLAAADVMVFPTLRDCWGMVVNEALAAGLPVLCSRYAGACDELVHDGVGRRFDPLDPADFDAALRAAVAGAFRDLEVADLRRAVAGHTCEEATRVMLDAARAACAGRRLASPA